MMKMNKLAAGALALALGLGAVAPAVAAEGNTGKTFVESAYNEQIKEVEKLFVKKEADRVALEKAKAALEAAMKEVKETKKAYDDAAKAEKEEKSKTVSELQTAYDTAKTTYEEKLKAFNDAANDKDVSDEEKAKAEEAYRKAYEEYTKAQTALSKAVEAEKEGKPEAKLTPKAIAFSAYNQALIKEGKANADVDKADRAYNGYDTKDKDGKLVHVDGSKAKFNNALAQLTRWAEGAGAILKIEGGKVVVKPAEKEVKKDNIAELKRAREEALTAIKAVKLLKELSPEKIKNVEAKLNKLVAKNEELVKKADAKIAAAEKKMAFIATAYADEEADDTDALIKELDSTTSEIKELIKDKPEEKKPEEKKPEEKKPEEKTPSKKAGNNARTGIAGVAGVAGILAAASVAYAASKRD